MHSKNPSDEGEVAIGVSTFALVAISKYHRNIPVYFIGKYRLSDQTQQQLQLHATDDTLKRHLLPY